jgi:hypothetical protein
MPVGQEHSLPWEERIDPQHSVCASSTVSGRLAEASAKNSKPKDFQDIVPMSLHAYADIFSETAFDSLPERRKWDHAIELEREPSPGFRKVYPMTLTEQTEMDTFLEEALATGRIRQSKSPLRAPVFFIKRKTESFASSKTIEPSMPLPGRIDICSH